MQRWGFYVFSLRSFLSGTTLTMVHLGACASLISGLGFMVSLRALFKATPNENNMQDFFQSICGVYFYGFYVCLLGLLELLTPHRFFR